MYESIKETLLDLFRAPNGPPESPGGGHESIQIFRASKRYLAYQMMILMITMIILGLIMVTVGIVIIVNEPLIGVMATVLMAIMWLLVLIGSQFIIRLEYDMRYYIVTDRSLRVRKGVWSILEQTLTFVNVQNITVEQGPIERMFGISRVVVDTAGGGGSSAGDQQASFHNNHRAVLNGLQNAEEIRDMIINYLKTLPKTGGLGAPDEHHYEMHPGSGMSKQEVEILRDILAEAKGLSGVLEGSSK
jgi:membrane protein YdbS with pleckstrin-like domain